MRTIKFRAWDEKLKEMSNGEPLGSDLFWDINRVFMQFTGLKDKNGKEIYEGDIIGYPNEQIKSVVCFGEYYFGGDEYGVTGVGFYLSRYLGGIKQDNEREIYSCPSSQNEVIGNKFENPELLVPKSSK